MNKNIWVDFVKEYRKKHPSLKYGDVLRKASKSAEWIKYKDKYGGNVQKKMVKKTARKNDTCKKGKGIKCDCNENKYLDQLIGDDNEMLSKLNSLIKQNKSLKAELSKKQ